MRFTRTLIPCLLLVTVVLVMPSGAQPYGTGFIVSTVDGDLCRVSQCGQVITLGNYGPGSIRSMAWDADNQHLAVGVATSINPQTGHLLRVNMATGQATTMVPAVGYPSDIVEDQNGDYLVSAQIGFGRPHILRVRRDGSTVATVLASLKTMSRFLQDRITGDWIVSHDAPGIHRYAHDWSHIKAMTPHRHGYIHQMVQDPHTPDMYFANGDFIRYDPGSGTFTSMSLWLPNAMGGLGFAIDRSPASSAMIYYTTSTSSTSEIKVFSRTGACLGTFATVPGTVTSMVFDRSRNLAAVLRKAPADRVLLLSFPTDAGKPYAVGLSLSGYTPNASLPDGRTLPLTPDALTYLTVQQELPPWITGNHGVLTAAGTGVVHLNFNQLGNAIRGVYIWAMAVTFDPEARLGISQISKPLLLIL